MSKKGVKPDLVALYRLEFYRKQKNWKFAREREKKRTKDVKKKVNTTYTVAESTESVLNKAFLDSDADSPRNLKPKQITPEPYIPEVAQSSAPETNTPQTNVSQKKLLRAALYWGKSDWPDDIPKPDEWPDEDDNEIPPEREIYCMDRTEKWANWPDDRSKPDLWPLTHDNHLWPEVQDWIDGSDKEWPNERPDLLRDQGWPDLWPEEHPEGDPCQQNACQCYRNDWLPEPLAWTNKEYQGAGVTPALATSDAAAQLDPQPWAVPRPPSMRESPTLRWADFARGAHLAPHSSELELRLSPLSLTEMELELMKLELTEAPQACTARVDKVLQPPPGFPCDSSGCEEYPTRDVGLQRPSGWCHKPTDGAKRCESKHPKKGTGTLEELIRRNLPCLRNSCEDSMTSYRGRNAGNHTFVPIDKAPITSDSAAGPIRCEGMDLVSNCTDVEYKMSAPCDDRDGDLVFGLQAESGRGRGRLVANAFQSRNKLRYERY